MRPDIDQQMEQYDWPSAYAILAAWASLKKDDLH
jgi:hypothetical protein